MKARASFGRLPAGSLVIADLHLDPSGDERVDAFCAWLAALDVPALVILGDLFDVWVGPAQARLDGAARVLAALRALVARATRVAFVPGNRDFLMGADLETGTGAQVFAEGFVAELPNADERVLFIHGDELCTLDVGYQRLKSVVRSPLVRWVAPRMPLGVARWAAGRLRKASQRAVPRKPAAQKEMQVGACRQLAEQNAASVVVCGHAHDWRDETLAEAGARWIVLDAWEGERDMLRVTADGLVPSSSRASSSGQSG